MFVWQRIEKPNRTYDYEAAPDSYGEYPYHDDGVIVCHRLDVKLAHVCLAMVITEVNTLRAEFIVNGGCVKQWFEKVSFEEMKKDCETKILTAIYEIKDAINKFY